MQVAGGRAMALKGDKIIVPKGTRITLQNLSNEKYNGMQGNVLEYDRAAEDTPCKLQEGKISSGGRIVSYKNTYVIETCVRVSKMGGYVCFL